MVRLVGSQRDREDVVLTREERVSLHQIIKQIEGETTAEICVMLVKDAQDPGALAAEYFAHLGIGKKHLDNGVFMLVVLARRHIELLVGRGLAEALPRSFLERVITEVLAPHFQANRFGAGLSFAVETIGEALRIRLPEQRLGEPGSIPDVVDLEGTDRPQ
jgi:uncharacterized membrane protein YgcG